MLASIKNIHFIGIGGIGMSGIAEFLHFQGFQISGSDLIKSDRTDYLSNLGIEINIGHSVKNINNPDIVVYSSAVKIDNIEILESKNKNIPVIKRGIIIHKNGYFRFILKYINSSGIKSAGTANEPTVYQISMA